MSKKLVALLLLFALIPFSAARSSIFNGTIDQNNSYAWGSKLGWLNFAPQNGASYVGLNITDTAVSGYAWSRQYGWLNFAPDNGGVTNNCAGALGGYAWSSHLGWVSLAGAGIDANGNLIGLAGSASDVAGQINFNCTHCAVKTDWRPCAARPAVCGNGVIESGEACDNGVNNGACPKTCSSNCQTNLCGATGAGGGGIGVPNPPPVNTNPPTSTPPTGPVATSTPSIATTTPTNVGGLGYDYWYVYVVNRADIVRDGKIDVLDFNALMVNWGKKNKGNRADTNLDGRVDIFDFNNLMINWGKIENK